MAGVVVSTLLLAGVGGWASTTEFSGAVITNGTVVVDTNVKKVQHPTGGVVAKLFVREGQRIRAGDIVARLDETVTRANLAIVAKSLDELRARKSRLVAERDRLAAVAMPASFADREAEPDVVEAMASERSLFAIRREARAGQKSQLRQRIEQLLEEIKGQENLREAKADEVSLIHQELEGVRSLWMKNLVPMNRLTALEREATRLRGEQAQSLASTAQAKGRIAEIELQIIQIDQDLSSEVAKELRDVDSKIGEATERVIAAEDQLKRIDIRSPQDGYVLQLSIHTVGGVISPGETVMQIVPDDDALSVEAKVLPQDIDQIRFGQEAVLRFSAFSQRVTPEVFGKVTRISADVSVDPKTNQSYYLARIGIDMGEIERLGSVRIVPGMPVEVFMKTHDRTVMSYFTKPLHDQVQRAFRER